MRSWLKQRYFALFYPLCSCIQAHCKVKMSCRKSNILTCIHFYIQFLNPGGSTKDRVALSMINTAEKEHILTPGNGSTIFEGTVGSTGISLAMMAKARGYNAWIVMPDDVALEKSQLLEKLGAHVEKVRPVSIVDKNQFVNLAKRRAQEFGKDDNTSNSSDESSSDGSHKTGFFADQFENLANFNAHFTTTGPEIYRQTQGNVDAIVMGAGKFLPWTLSKI